MHRLAQALKPLSPLISVLILLLSMVFALGGWSASGKNIEKRVDKLEQITVPRSEYETQQQEIIKRLDRIENKLDREIERGGK